MASKPHVSTGSTVDTFLTQPSGPAEDVVFEPSLPNILEEGVSSGDNNSLNDQ